ncbi:MAG: hypothetical protein HY860_03625 [Chlamydiales bacterium]|nr:hypothetical protein [Chlamydiales bacterium]
MDVVTSTLIDIYEQRHDTYYGIATSLHAQYTSIEAQMPRVFDTIIDKPFSTLAGKVDFLAINVIEQLTLYVFLIGTSDLDFSDQVAYPYTTPVKPMQKVVSTKFSEMDPHLYRCPTMDKERFVKISHCLHTRYFPQIRDLFVPSISLVKVLHRLDDSVILDAKTVKAIRHGISESIDTVVPYLLNDVFLTAKAHYRDCTRC